MTQRTTGRDEALGEGTGWIRGIVTQEANDGRNPPERGLGFVAFPIANRPLVDPDLGGNLRLEKSKVESAGAKVHLSYSNI